MSGMRTISVSCGQRSSSSSSRKDRYSQTNWDAAEAAIATNPHSFISYRDTSGVHRGGTFVISDHVRGTLSHASSVNNPSNGYNTLRITL